MIWKTFVVHDPNEGNTEVIEAPSFGIAVDYFLIMRGMLSYKKIEVRECKLTPHSSAAREEVERTMGACLSPDRIVQTCRDCDENHQACLLGD